MAEFTPQAAGLPRQCDNIRVFAQGGQLHLNFEVRRFPGADPQAQAEMETTASLVLSPDVARKLAAAIEDALAAAP